MVTVNILIVGCAAADDFTYILKDLSIDQKIIYYTQLFKFYIGPDNQPKNHLHLHTILHNKTTSKLDLTINQTGRRHLGNVLRHFVGVLDSCGCVLEAFRRHFTRFWEAFCWCFGGFRRHFGDLLETFWRHFGGVTDVFWRHFEGFLEAFWRNFGGI